MMLHGQWLHASGKFNDVVFCMGSPWTESSQITHITTTKERPTKAKRRAFVGSPSAHVPERMDEAKHME